MNYAVITYWVGENDISKVWLYATKEEAIKAMNRLWEQSFNFALEDDNFHEKKSYHEEEFAQVVWDDGLIRYFEVVKISTEERI